MFYSTYQRQQKYKTDEDQRQTLFSTSWPASYYGQIMPSKAFLANWHLEIKGLVSEPLVLTLDDLLSLPMETQHRRLVSAQGWTYRSEWQGILLNTLIERVKPLPSAKFIKQRNLAGQSESLPLDGALGNGSLLCLKEGNNPLSLLYGGPIQMMVFHLFSYKGLGQLVELEFTEEESNGYWQSQGYSIEGQVQPGSYYAFDLREMRPVPFSGEVTEY